jgi:hypothetical protein
MATTVSRYVGLAVRCRGSALSELDRVRDKASWHDTLLSVLTAWNRHQVWKILTAVVVIWIVSGTALHFAERGTNPVFETWGESLWNVWVTLFSGLSSAPNSPVGRLVVSVVLVVGVALAGLFTASVRRSWSNAH